ncbi:MAG: gephyrin-like molybdotransferase Glp, partial [Bacillota bacterium]
THGASEGLPALFRVVGQVYMGEAPRTPLGPGEAMQIATGGMLPVGSDAVVMIEHTESMDEETLLVMRPVASGENVLARGEDIREGESVLRAGRRLSPADLGVLASLGQAEVDVWRKPTVGIISTGDELVAPGQAIGPGQIYDINANSLAGLCREMGIESRQYGIIGDDFLLLHQTLARARRENDLVLLSGGTSVGARDLTVRVIEESGGPGVLVHGLNIKPGKPTIIALLDDKPVFGLSGNPVTAALTFQLLVEPTLLRWPGVCAPYRGTVRGRLTRNVTSASGMVSYIRVNLTHDGDKIAVSPVLGKSGLMTTLALAEGYFCIPATREGMAAGEEVEVTLLRCDAQ